MSRVMSQVNNVGNTGPNHDHALPGLSSSDYLFIFDVRKLTNLTGLSRAGIFAIIWKKRLLSLLLRFAKRRRSQSELVQP